MGNGVSSLRSLIPKKGKSRYHDIYLNYANKKIFERYDLDYVLGRGGYSVIIHGIDTFSKKEIAMKIMKLENGDLMKVNSVFAELAAFERINGHDFIVKLHSAFYHNHCCYFVMDCFSGGDLRLFLRTNNSLNEKSVVYLLACIGSALHHLHSRGVVHRDVKPENIGLDLRGRPYLADFGISVVSSDENPLPLCQSSSGTLAYLAPEVLCEGNCHSYQSDFWSLGVMGYELLFGKRPFPKHCPVAYLKFVRDEYGWMWDSLLLNPYGNLMDLGVIQFPIDWIPPSSDLSFCVPGSVPSDDCHVVPIPLHCRSISGDPLSEPTLTLVSEECQRLLKGLMDVRIPSRLGNMSRYSEFSEHDCFLQYDGSPSPDLTSPLLPLSIIPTPTNIIQPHSILSFEDEPLPLVELPRELTALLSQFTYFRPKIDSFCLHPPPPPQDSENKDLSHRHTTTLIFENSSASY